MTSGFQANRRPCKLKRKHERKVAERQQFPTGKTVRPPLNGKAGLCGNEDARTWTPTPNSGTKSFFLR